MINNYLRSKLPEEIVNLILEYITIKPDLKYIICDIHDYGNLNEDLIEYGYNFSLKLKIEIIEKGGCDPFGYIDDHINN